MARLRLDPDTSFLHALRNDLELNNLRCLWARAVRRSHGARRWAARALRYAGFGNGHAKLVTLRPRHSRESIPFPEGFKEQVPQCGG
jgi:hypothetical protein